MCINRNMRVGPIETAMLESEGKCKFRRKKRARSTNKQKKKDLRGIQQCMYRKKQRYFLDTSHTHSHNHTYK